MFNKKILATLVILGLITTVGVSAVYAYHGDANTTGPNYNPERHTAMQTALQNSDFAAWQKLMGDRPITQKINQDNFAKFAQAWQLAQDGKLDEARALRQELGLGQGFGRGMGQANGKHFMHQGNKAAGHFVDANHDGICDNYNQQ